ncbi:MAG: pantetheine-phosphate adenylyltransferase [Cetobacterium sp.]|uniref:pantetheine-phosphate adenylyltransferase n=1 Tax=unclassified Cetobacterium TaxID=2630983 RepID=UPI00163C0107|nr:pantetheine-phosphate adenylyltransferase [Cetobacterium sp. 2A]MBC2855961.1 pantetheine-phosphate adenylyltransferase [Cetobacterium sp. 2A]
MKVAVYAGSFDPITKGHQDIIRRASKICDKLIVAVLNNSSKKYWFNLEERKTMVKKLLADLPNIEVVDFSGLLVDFMVENSIEVIIRGLRAVSDYEYELTLAYGNYDISDGEIETILIPAAKEYLYLSSSVVREIATYNGKLDKFIDERIIDDIRKRAGELKG